MQKNDSTLADGWSQAELAAKLRRAAGLADWQRFELREPPPAR